MSNSELERNKEIVRRYFEMTDDNPDNAEESLQAREAMFSDDAHIETMNKNLGWWSGHHCREKVSQMIRATGPKDSGATKLFKNGMHMIVHGMTAEGDRVAIEVESHAETVDGRIYNNFYHFLVTVRDGKIVQIKEYFDTLHSAIILYGLGSTTYLDLESFDNPYKSLKDGKQG